MSPFMNVLLTIAVVGIIYWRCRKIDKNHRDRTDNNNSAER